MYLVSSLKYFIVDNKFSALSIFIFVNISNNFKISCNETASFDLKVNSLFNDKAVCNISLNVFINSEIITSDSLSLKLYIFSLVIITLNKASTEIKNASLTIEEYSGFLSDISNLISLFFIFSSTWGYNSGIF